MFKSLLGVVENVARVVTAPIEIAANTVSVVTKPVADAAQECVDEVKDIMKDN